LVLEPAQPVPKAKFQSANEASATNVHLPHGVARRHHKLQGLKKPVSSVKAALNPRRLKNRLAKWWAVPS